MQEGKYAGREERRQAGREGRYAGREAGMQVGREVER